MQATVVSILVFHGALGQYSPDWESLDSRPLPSWYDEAKIGIFMHWGPYSVPGVVSEWFWFYWKRNDPNNSLDQTVNQYMDNFYPPGFTYQQFGEQFKAEFFNATQWAELVESSGAKYFVFTSKHHDGFANWPNSRNFGWNSMDVGPKRDIIGELAKAFQNVDVKFGLYHSLFEWFNPLYLQDKANKFSTKQFVTDRVLPEMAELIVNYQPQVLWSDGEGEAEDEYWDSKNFLAWLYNKSPVKDTIVTNDRWGRGLLCKHGGFYTCSDRYNPGVLQSHKWENAMTIDRASWGYRRNMRLEDILSMEELLETMVMTISCGGNLLINVGPTSQGTIDSIFQERLRQMGAWLRINGEAVYRSVPWIVQNDTWNSNVWYTSKVDKDHGTVVFGFLLKWPTDGKLVLGSPEIGPNTKISILGYGSVTEYGPNSGHDSIMGQKSILGYESKDVYNIKDQVKRLVVQLPEKEKISSQWTWVVRFQNLANAGNSLW